MSMPSFLESDVAPAAPQAARFHVIPVPYEASVSYGGGPADGPRAILEASLQLEAFDGTGIPALAGIHTAPPIGGAGRTAEEMLAAAGLAVERALAVGAIPVVLGGEHTVSLAPIRVLAAQRPTPFGVVQFDAHADLRASYQGNFLSHACIGRRIVELGLPLFQVGVRSLSQECHEFRQVARIPHLDAARLAAGDAVAAALPPDFPEEVYVTFDIDAFDPGIVPGTGTPEPGGLGWYQAIAALQAILTGRRLIGFDVVEVAPTPHSHVSEFTAAKLVYTMMAMAVS